MAKPSLSRRDALRMLALGATGEAAFVPGSNCDNCLELQGAPGNDYRPCGIFPGKLVSVRGWCSRWSPEI